MILSEISSVILSVIFTTSDPVSLSPAGIHLQHIKLS